MKLQISFNFIDNLENSIKIAEEIADFCDIFEIGSLPLLKFGIEIVIQFKKHFPKKSILVSTQIVDYGKDISELILNSGADWITVMAGTNDLIIHSVTSKVNEKNKKVMLDLTDTNLIEQSAMDAQKLGVDAILYNIISIDEEVFLKDRWEMLRGNSKLPIYISSEITRDNIEKYINLNPDGIVIGKAIIESKDPKSEAEFFYNLINKKTI